MTKKDYVDLAMRSDRNYQEVADRLTLDENKVRLINASMGLSGEVGEVVDIIKKHIIYNKELDHNKVKEEVGDVLWYVALLLKSLNSSFEEVMIMNIEKLKKRYPHGFTEEAAKGARK